MGCKDIVLGKNFSTWWSPLYFVDWILAIALLIITSIIEKTISPYRRYLPANDPSVSYPVEAGI